ncbi:hypothetical protein RIU76_06420 [Latilactobacillus sakei subsp. sakei]|uniref:hypothetical protein n=1 Tax=Latilactobacillus sakei TaxID=1599 RepID=UPI002859EE18|nr:hypothetical protein [Latilactobacillus sakei]MDR7924359.1 hypothetical protein [Latilactobacillus sakei subsp. sakei]
MDDRQVEIIAEHLMSGQRISVYDVQRHFKLNKGQATELLNLAQIKVEDNKNARQTQKQTEATAKRRTERYFNRASGRRSRSYR